MKTIIVIEDDYIIRDNVIQILNDSNFIVTGFDDGNLALKNILNSPPDLIICDIMMPKMSGYEIINVIKKNSQTNTIPFIFITAKAENNEIRKGMELGANDYLIKPFTIKQLLNSVNLKIYEKELQNKTLENKLFEKLDAIKIITNHEYNTPLNGIINLTDLLISNLNNLAKDEIIEYLNMIKISAERLTKSKNKLFRIIDLLSNNNNHEPETITLSDIQVLIKNIIDKISEYSLNDKKIVFEVPKMKTEKFISFSYLHLSEIISEIIGNAVKFATEGSTVKIKLNLKHTSYLTLEIQNTNLIVNNFVVDLNFLDAKDCTKGDSSIKSGLFITNKLCQLNNSEFKIFRNEDFLVCSSIKMNYIDK